ncbi:hypothetical protein JM18_005322 [Phytophthora kernoviae]|uniref:Transmembrane protein n=2 Tax=Phytophthora kernoviae TaxID=325452 RepID=A0A8T0LVQ7_9STRA|nr:hypothetical protein G195_005821 [Phytophthora kernoviae 00238/432]KAG2522943.1 hypothetical protein JM16_005586 [Phytophthora kernoviae]KAG2524555.1 hypothetical protein JM18_005322 [Phytophthora kernoviae]
MNRFVAGPDFYNYDMYGGLRSGGGVNFFSSVFVGLIAATFTSSFVYVGARYGLLVMVSSKLELSESQTEAMDRLVEVPAALAFFVGLYADAVPVGGSRRKSYMVLDSLMSSSFRYVMMLLMGGVSFGSMINFCSVHTAVVTLSQRESLERRGVFQADYLLVRAAGQISARLLVYLIQNVVEMYETSLMMLMLMPISIATIILVVEGLDEPEAFRKESLRCKCESYWKLTKQKAVWRVLLLVASFAFFLNFGFPLATDALREWTDTTDNASALLSSSLNDLVMIATVLMWRWKFRNTLWRRLFAVAPTVTITQQVLLTVLIVPDIYRYPAVYIVLAGLGGVATGIMALALLVPVTEIIEEGTEGGVVGLALSFNTIFKIFVSTLLTSIQRASFFPSSDDEDTSSRRWLIGILQIIACCANGLAFISLMFLPIQKLDAQLVRMYGGYTDSAGAITAAAFLTSLAYCVAYNIYIFSEAINN